MWYAFFHFTSWVSTMDEETTVQTVHVLHERFDSRDKAVAWIENMQATLQVGAAYRMEFFRIFSDPDNKADK